MVLGCFWAAFGVSWLLGAAIGDSQVTLGGVFWAAFGVSLLLLAAIGSPQVTFGGSLGRSREPLGDPLGRNPFLNAIWEA